MVNTVIQIKYSVDNDKPISLNIAELAYSFTSNTLFLGNTSNGVINVGGVYYTTILDRATSNATTNTLVLRDNHGSALFNVVTANTILGNFVGTLANTGVEAGTYGGATQIPVFTVDDDGRVSYAANVSVATDLTIAADTGSNTISLLTDVLTFSGGDGITTSIDPTDNVKFDVDSTVVRTNKTSQIIGGDVQITGNLLVSGNNFTVNVQNYRVEDTIVYLAANNYYSDMLDIGFAGNYYDGESQKHFGVIREHNTNNVWIFTGYDGEFENNLLNTASPSLVYANVRANITGGRVFDLSQPIKVVDGGTGKNTFTTGAILIGNGQGDFLELSNTTSNGTYGNSNFVPVVTIDEYGRVSSITTEAIFENAIIDCGTY